MGRIFTVEEYAVFRRERFDRAVKTLESLLSIIYRQDLWCSYSIKKHDTYKDDATERVLNMEPRFIDEQDDPMFWKHALGLHPVEGYEKRKINNR